MPQNFYVYILRCSDKSYYTGITNNVDERLKKHNSGKAAKYTNGRRPVKLVYSEKHDNKSSALRREHQIKKLRRAGKEALIASGTVLC